MANKLLAVIGGPTGVGKTEVAITVAKHFSTEIVNADSRQVYKELNIGVGRPSPEQLASVPHHLIGHISVQEHYAAGQYAKDALLIIHHLFEKHDIVILTGGTGLYIKAVTSGLDPFPDIPQELYQKWTEMWKQDGIDALKDELARLDPDYLNEVDQKNPMRLIRALAVSDYTDRPYSFFRKGSERDHDFDIKFILLDLPREELYHRINIRVEKMIASGWLEETKSLLPFRDTKALNTVGYKELFQVLDGTLSLLEAIPLIQQATRRYAKRQLTWFNNQGSWDRFRPDDVEAILKDLA